MPYVCPICGLGAQKDAILWNQHKLYHHPHHMEMVPQFVKPKRKPPDLTTPMFPEAEKQTGLRRGAGFRSYD